MGVQDSFGVRAPGAAFAVSSLDRGVFGVLSVENKLRLEQEP
jgi:hypothetical protein